MVYGEAVGCDAAVVAHGLESPTDPGGPEVAPNRDMGYGRLGHSDGPPRATRGLGRIVRRCLGSRNDWRLYRPVLDRPRPSLSWLGPLVVVASVAVGWFAFANAVGEQSAPFGLFVGAASIQLMAWSFVLALRIKMLEPFFGGLDTMYRVHRWCGSIAVIAMFLHTQIEPEVKGIRGASRQLEDSAEELAGIAEIMLYVLVGISLIRLIPYRYWRFAHKLLGVPFLFASAHFFTSTKPYANGSGWGIWFATFMVVGAVAFLWRVIVRDMMQHGVAYTISACRHFASHTELDLEPTGKRRLTFRSGQFVLLRIERRGLGEPHPFSIASHPNDPQIRIVIRRLGDWSDRLGDTDLAGQRVALEGPYGAFRPIGSPGQAQIWVAGGVGITPFLSSLPVPGQIPEDVPHLFYAVRSVDQAVGLDRLRAADSSGAIHLHLFDASCGDRLAPAAIREALTVEELRGSHVALCGPSGLVREMRRAAIRFGAQQTEVEDFDFRQGFGPEVSREVESTVESARRVLARRQE